MEILPNIWYSVRNKKRFLFVFVDVWRVVLSFTLDTEGSLEVSWAQGVQNVPTRPQTWRPTGALGQHLGALKGPLGSFRTTLGMVWASP